MHTYDSRERSYSEASVGHWRCPLSSTLLNPLEGTAEKAKKIHLRVASGKPVRALMYQGVIYANSVERTLLSADQLRDALVLHLLGRTSIRFSYTPVLKTERDSYLCRVSWNTIYP